MSGTMFYVIYAVLLFVAELAYFRVAEHYNIIDRPNERSSHTRVTLRGGGVIFYMGALICFLATGFPAPGFFAGLTLISAVSFTDDVHSLSPRVRLLLQLLAMLLMFQAWGIYTLANWWVVLVALVLCTGIINVYNFMDGINGITGGYSLVVLASLAYVNERVMPFTDSRLIFCSMIAAAVFCFFNFRKKARCFAGDVGSVSIAFIIIFILGKLVLHTGDLSWLCFLVVYGVDGTLTIFHRLMLHENISLPHRKHAFQLMANELHIPHVVVSSVYMAMQAVASAVVIVWPGYTTLMIVTLLLSILYIIFMKRYFHLHKA